MSQHWKSIVWVLMLLAASTCAANTTVRFFYAPANGLLTCIPEQISEAAAIPTICPFDDAGQLEISRESWGDIATLSEDGTITGACRNSLLKNPDLDFDYNLVPDCLPGDNEDPIDPVDPNRKDATGALLLEEWFTDLPWHQKLSTKDSNVIETPFVMPYAALPKDQCPTTESSVDKARCMLRYGIVNVMGMHRTDRLYASGEAPTKNDCLDDNCVEVKLEIQRFNTLTDEAPGYQAEVVTNDEYFPAIGRIPSLGFAITEATVFAPWRPWYTGHFCAANGPIRDAVCYEDYFTTQLLATGTTSQWLSQRPAVFSPIGTNPGYETFCKSGNDYCRMFLGKVDWVNDVNEPQVVGCISRDLQICKDEVVEQTSRLEQRFNTALTKFYDNGRYPWGESAINLTTDINNNPFIGYYDLVEDVENAPPLFSFYRARRYVLPKQCTKADFFNARLGSAATGQQSAAIHNLENCVLNFEVHTGGFYDQWKELWGGSLTDEAIQVLSDVFVGIGANQYGRTMFMYAGVPEQHIPVSFKIFDDGLSAYDKIYNASRYTQYIPLVNPAEQELLETSYQNNFWHGIFMSNHMNQTPDHFIRGIRGRTLWHNEYRSNYMYQATVEPEANPRINGTVFENILDHVDFPAGFQVNNAKSPFHGNTCDSCHVRNGSGIPLMPNGKLPKIHTDRGMKADFEIQHDYTYTNPELPSMKLVLFDIESDTPSIEYCDTENDRLDKNLFSTKKAPYKNKIMNFYGDSFHVNQKNGLPTYNMKYVAITKDDNFEIVDTTSRGVFTTYEPKKVVISGIETACERVKKEAPSGVAGTDWPRSCDDVSGEAVTSAIKNREIGFMHLLGRRLGNTPMIEMMPNKIIRKIQRKQKEEFDGEDFQGCYRLTAGTRSGNNGALNYRNCSSGEYGKSKNDCYISRWGWIGDRASLEDQVANAAIVEMGVTSTASYDELHHDKSRNNELVRYDEPECGLADKNCLESPANSDITEQEIRDMATYQRWIGIPNRSEYQVFSNKVQLGEKIFKDLRCNSCHVIDKIAFDEKDNMLPDEEREQLKALQIKSGGDSEYPFISYLGTDLLLHDMGYLSQVAEAPEGEDIRNKVGAIKPAYENYIQHIRTPALKGLRFNRFVTDSNNNTVKPLGKGYPVERDPEVVAGCDFLLHDGRACDAIEAAYLHDGPAVNRLKMIKKLNKLTELKLDQLRAFLYSL